MARKLSIGYELNTTTTDMEGFFIGGVGTANISSTTFRSGLYALDLSASTQSGRVMGFNIGTGSNNVTGDFYFRFYVRIVSTPNAQIRIFRTFTFSGGNQIIGIRMNTDRTLELWNEEDAAQIGTDSAALSTDTWYRVEVRINCTTPSSTDTEARINGTAFASGNVNLATGLGSAQLTDISVSGNQTSNLIFDDFALNDSSGSFQNSWPGEGEIIHLRPNAEGDTIDWTPSTGTDHYAMVDEVTPDDNTTQVRENVLDTVEEFNLDATPAALEATDDINCVQVGVRFKGQTTQTTSMVLRIKATASGTVEESSNISVTNGTWFTNSNASPRNYALTLYDLPGASTTAWTKTELDTAQIGAKVSVAQGSNQIYVSTLWLLVDHAPTAAPSTVVQDIIGMGMIPFAR